MYQVNTYRPSAIRALDTRILVHEAPWVYTSPNLDTIPVFDPNPCELRARRDARFGLEDYVCHPQGYSEAYPWAPVIPKQPLVTAALQAHPYALCWYDLGHDDWRCPTGGAFTRLGTIDLQIYTEMYTVVVGINTHAVSLF